MRVGARYRSTTTLRKTIFHHAGAFYLHPRDGIHIKVALNRLFLLCCNFSRFVAELTFRSLRGLRAPQTPVCSFACSLMRPAAHDPPVQYIFVAFCSADSANLSGGGMRASPRQSAAWAQKPAQLRLCRYCIRILLNFNFETRFRFIRCYLIMHLRQTPYR